jgi:LPXTG-motif cell wall-anchored protein
VNGRSTHPVHPRRIAAAALTALAATALPSGVGSAATVGDTASADITLDAPGTLTLDAFDPALGTLTAVQMSLRVDVEVQACIENTSATAGSMAGGTATGSLDATFPGGANATVATVEASLDPVQLAASNGTSDCAAGFDDATGRFPDQVTATDTVFFEDDDLTLRAATLTGPSAVAPFIGTGTIAVTFTPNSDTELVLPAEWDNLAAAQGALQATITYTYTPAADLGPQLPGTGSNSNRIVTIATIAVLIGITAILAARRWRPRHTPPAANN